MADEELDALRDEIDKITDEYEDRIDKLETEFEVSACPDNRRQSSESRS